MAYGLGGVTQQGDDNQALHVAKFSSASWIVDFGTFDHMTSDKSLVSQFYPSRSHHTIRIANGSHAKVVGKGTIQLSETLTLYSILFVSDLDCNLLSVSKLNKDLNCETKFLANSCVFQDLESSHDLRTWCQVVSYESNKDSAVSYVIEAYP